MVFLPAVKVDVVSHDPDDQHHVEVELPGIVDAKAIIVRASGVDLLLIAHGLLRNN